MDEPRDLTHDALAAAMRRSYEINVSAIEFLPGGEDTNAWVYRVDAEDASAARILQGLFDRGEIVELALSSHD